MTIIASAPVPSHLNLREADTLRFALPAITDTLAGVPMPSGQTTPCPDWCAAKGQHLADEHPDDRAHYSEGREVFRSLDMAAAGRPTPPAWACLVHFDYEPQARINAFLGADHPVDLTPAEAREYAAALIALADTAEQTGEQ